MKNIYLRLFCLFLILMTRIFTANAQIKESCTGEWNFKCPDASEGFDSGIIKITIDSVYTEYPGIKHTFSSKRVELINNTLCFNVEIDGQQSLCKIISKDANIFSGYLVTKSGTFPIVLIKADPN
jgi:hypothetical protein